MCQSSTMLWQPGHEVEDLASLKDKIDRITNYLKELKTLSKSCQELTSVTPQLRPDKNEEHGERQIFVRRIIQLQAEIEDSRDLVLLLCKKFMPQKQWRLMAEEFQVVVDGDDFENGTSRLEFGWGMLTGLVDPSVRFFGMDWEIMFQRCRSISEDIKDFGDKVQLSSIGVSERFDLSLVNKILKDLASIEADVNSHAEAVLQGRLSKSQRKLIHKEQLKYSSVVTCKRQPTSCVTSSPCLKKSSVPKSQSFCDQTKLSANHQKTTTTYKFKRSKTSSQMSEDLSHSYSQWTRSPEKRGVNFCEEGCFNACDEQQQLIDRTAATLVTTTNSRGTVVTVISTKTSTAIADLQFTKKKSSFLQNLSVMLKNIR